MHKKHILTYLISPANLHVLKLYTYSTILFTILKHTGL